MSDPLTSSPHFAEAVEAMMRVRDDCGMETSRAVDSTALTAALPALRKMLAEELRAEAEREVTERGSPFFRGMLAQGAHFGWKEAADFIERAE